MMSPPARSPSAVPTADDPDVRTSRGAETKAKILEAALDLFRERGYDETTMRAVAERAGVSLGNAYYYFASKEPLLQGYYLRMDEEHAAASEPVLAREHGLEERLRGVLHAKLDVSEPYHRFAGLLFKTAADPKSPLNPFGAESTEARRRNISLFARVLEGSRMRVPDDLRARLPELLWVHSMGIILYWIHDESPGRQRSRRLVDRSVDLIVRLVSLASNPLLRPLRRRVVQMLEEVAGDLVSPA